MSAQGQQQQGQQPDVIANAVTAAIEALFAGNPNFGTTPATVGAFAKSPARAVPDVIDYTTKTGAAIYKSATEALPTVFNISKPNLPVLLDELKTRSTASKWDDIFTIPDSSGTDRDLLTQWGLVTEEECTTKSTTYIQTQSRAAQNNYQLFECLQKTLDAKSKDKLAHFSTRYTINGESDGVTYLYLIIAKATAKSRAMAASIRESFVHLREYMQDTAKEDIVMFNTHVRRQRDMLQAVGETSSDLLSHLFSAYLSVSDERFRHSVEAKQDAYDGGEQLTVDDLLEHTENIFNLYRERKHWKAKSPQQEELVALRAEVKQMKAVADKEKKARQKQKQREERRKKRMEQQRQRDGQTQVAQAEASKHPKKKKWTGKMAWRGVAPKSGEPNTKSVDGRDYSYCSHHGWWNHLTKDCRVIQAQKKTAKDETKDEPKDEITASMATVGIQDVVSDEE